MHSILHGVLLPLWGTTLGAAFVFFSGKRALRTEYLDPLAAGIMLAASVFSLLLPAAERSDGNPLPILGGFWLGILFLSGLERIIPYDATTERTKLMRFAVVLHNFPEGMAVGAAFSAVLSGTVPYAAAFSLALGIALQNIPEGAIISLPLQKEGLSRKQAFLRGVLSGIVEPIGAGLTLLAAGFLTALLPFLLSFAAGAMVYVVLETLSKEKSVVLPFCLGFSLMMAMDLFL